MKLLIHAGTHKTATTTFQRTCYKFNNILLRNRVLYPILEEWKECNNHAYIARSLQELKSDTLTKYFYKIAELAINHNAKTVLLSSEDLENSIVDGTFSQTLINTARGAGFNEIEWIFCLRDQRIYFDSIYGELSRQGGVLNYKTILKTAAQTGFISYSANNYNYIFAIKAKELLQKNINNFQGSKITTYNFNDFAVDPAGYPLLKTLINQQDIEKIKSIGLMSKFYNERQSEIDVEIQYTLNFLGIKSISNNRDFDNKTIYKIANYRLQSKHY